jgi:GDP-L-fucose synthase
LKPVLILGSTGFLGRHLIRNLSRSTVDYFTPSRAELDLLNLTLCIDYFKKLRPKIVVHLAALSGGIGANLRTPADFFFQNIAILANVYNASSICGSVEKIVYPIGGCSYPENVVSPITEDQLWRGYPHSASAAYSTAKLMGTVAAEAYRRQFNIKTQLLIPGNMYGEFDNFSLEDSHVIPALIRKLITANNLQQEAVTVWGTGSALRDFVYAGDVARIIASLICEPNVYEIFNVSTGISTSIRECVTHIKKLIGYQGEIIWDNSKSDGQLVKIFDTSRLTSLGFSCETPLLEGLEKTIDWYKSNPKDIRL